MDSKSLRIEPLKDHSDNRGLSFSLAPKAMHYLDKIENLHIGTIVPGAVRGNHYHEQKKEILIIIYSDIWEFGYQEKDDNQPTVRKFEGAGAVGIEIAPGVVHGIKNTGSKDLIIAVCTDYAHNDANPDIIREIVV